MLASGSGHAEVVDYLLEAGADPNLQNHSGHTALRLAKAAQVREVFFKHMGAAVGNEENSAIQPQRHSRAPQATAGNRIIAREFVPLRGIELRVVFIGWAVVLFGGCSFRYLWNVGSILCSC